MAVDRDALRDWHRVVGLLLTDFFTGSPCTVEVERDLSQQQKFLDVVILRRGRGRFVGRLPDGLDGLAAHNLISFKSHRETGADRPLRRLPQAGQPVHVDVVARGPFSALCGVRALPA
jgi:hypothetical protein